MEGRWDFLTARFFRRLCFLLYFYVFTAKIISQPGSTEDKIVSRAGGRRDQIFVRAGDSEVMI